MNWWLKVERREAQRPTSLGARGALAARGGYVNPASKDASQASWRLPPLHRAGNDAGEESWQSSDAWRREIAEACRNSAGMENSNRNMNNASVQIKASEHALCLVTSWGIQLVSRVGFDRVESQLTGRTMRRASGAKTRARPKAVDNADPFMD